MSRSFSNAWLAGDAPPLLPLDPRDAAHRARAVEAAVGVGLSDDVAAAWKAQETVRVPEGATTPPMLQLEALATGEAVAVVTGQQAGLFSGPLYTVYKTAAAIVTARALEAETGVPAVPVFWLQTEDHDWLEIDHCSVPGADGPQRIDCQCSATGSDLVSVFHRRMGAGITVAVDALANAIGGLPSGAEVMASMRRHWRANVSPGEAMGGFIAELFRPMGLLVLDPRDPALARAAAPLHRDAFEHAEAQSAALLARNQELEQAGLRVQVHVRPRAPLSFVHPDGPQGPRYRVRPTDEGAYALVGTERRVSRDDIVTWLETEPARFSTSALQRPLLQDLWLPTAAYIGGPGELNYLAQSAALYPEHVPHGRPMPLVMVRSRFRLVDARSRRLLDQLGLSPGDTARPRDELLAAIAQPPAGAPEPETLLRGLTEPLREGLASLDAMAENLGGNFPKQLGKTRDHVLAQLEGLVERYKRTLARRDEVAVGRLNRLLAMLAPGGAPQERVYGWPWFAAMVGPETLRDLILAACVPFDPTLRDLELP